MAEARYEIDRRPIAIVLVSRLRRQLWIALLLGIFAFLLGLAPPQGLTTAGWGTLCVFALCATLYATALLPLAITSLLAIALVPMLDILGARETYAFFGSKVVFFILGAFMLSAAMSASGLSERAATGFVRRFGRTPRRLILSIFLLCALGSTVMSEHAVAVMVFPIVRDIARALDLRQPDSNTGRGIFFGMFWGCVIGGSLTVLGGGRGPLAIGILEEATKHTLTVSFVDYSLFALPMVIVLMATGYWLLRHRFPPEIDSTAKALTELEDRLRRMGKVTPREAVVGLVLVLTIGLWAIAGEDYGLANIALVSMAALFALGAVQWRDVQEHVDWGLVVMYGGAICLGSTMERTGAALWLTERVFEGVSVGPESLMMLIALGGAVATEFMSNSAVVAMLLPPALSLAEQQGIDLRAMTMAVVLPTNFAFLLPIATPVAALAWTSGYFTPRTVVINGLVLNLFAWLAMALLIYVWWPVIGLL
jgi:sodium-dependent dicarboxylate transporter 2/3/5